MVIVFDLDDTLYDEVMFVRGGFKAVSDYLELTYNIPASDSYHYMNERLKIGRNHIFDSLLSYYHLSSKLLVKKCVSIYRRHKPDIHLYPEAETLLENLKDYPVYIVTDGNKEVQKSKLLSLGLYTKVKFCFVTHYYGKINAKPSPYCFLKICQREKVSPEQVVYIGDNPNKDFVKIKTLGFKTIRVLQGHFKNIRKDKNFEADYIISSLGELNIDFLRKVLTAK